MPEPICERIDATIEADLGDIAVANGYSVTLASVEWGRSAAPTPAADLKCEIEVGDDEEPPEGSVPQRSGGWHRPYWIYVYILKAEDDDVLWKTWKNRVVADVQKRLMLNRQRTDSDGVSLADNTILRPPITFVDEDGLRGVIVRADIRYTTADTDPYVIR